SCRPAVAQTATSPVRRSARAALRREPDHVSIYFVPLDHLPRTDKNFALAVTDLSASATAASPRNALERALRSSVLDCVAGTSGPRMGSLDAIARIISCPNGAPTVNLLRPFIPSPNTNVS